MSTTFPFEFNGAEYIADAIVSKNPEKDCYEYFIKINGDDYWFIKLKKTKETYLEEISSSEHISEEMKEAIKKALRNQPKYPYEF